MRNAIQQGYLYNSNGDVWCGSVFGWMPMPSTKVLIITRAEMLIRVGIEMSFGANEGDYVFKPQTKS